MRPHGRLCPKTVRFLAFLAFAAFLAGALAPGAGAADRYWVRWVDDKWDYFAFHSDLYDSYGVWSAAYPILNDPGGASVPVAGDDVYLAKAEWTGWSTSVTLWTDYTPSSRLGSLTIDGPIPYDPSDPYVMTLFQRANLAVGTEFVGRTGSAAQHVQMSDTNDISGNLYIGYDSGGRGYYQLWSGSQLTVGGTEYVGFSGWADFTQGGGTHTIAGCLFLAYNPHAFGRFTLNDGTLRSAGIVVGDDTDAHGYFTQNGGRADTGDLTLAGYCAGSTGNYYLSAGTLAVAGSAFVGMQGNSLFQQNGGTQTIAGSLYVARWSGAHATYWQFGGTTNVSADTYVGRETGTDGLVRVSGGTLTTSSLTLGGSTGGPGGKGVLTIETGGTVTVNGPLKVWETPGSVINLSGGRLNAATLDYGADPSRLQWSSGTLNLSASDMALTEGSLLGTSLTLPATKTLMVGGSFYMGLLMGETEERRVTLDGGTHAVGYGLYVGNGDGHHGKYVLNSGRLTAGGVTLGGDGGYGEFYQWGGSAEIAGGIVLNPGSTPLNQASRFQLNDGTLTAGSVYVYSYGWFEQNGGDLRVGEFHLCGGSVTGVLQNRGTLFFDEASNLYAEVLNEGGIDFNVPTPYMSGGLVNTSATPLHIPVGVTLNVGAPGLVNDGVVNIAGSLQSSSCTVGDTATGTINQPWGHQQGHHDAGVLTLGNQAGATGNYNLSFGTLTAAAEYIGYHGHARFDQTGGTNQVNGNLTVAAYSGADGTYLLSNGGSLGVAGSAFIGDAGAGLFHQTGGTHRVEGSLYLGHSTGGSGTYELSDTGSLVVVGSEYIGFGAGTGKFTQTGGSHGVGGTIHVGTDTGGAGSYLLQDGELDSLVLQIHRKGTFTFGGGGVITAGTVNQNGTLNVTGDALVCSVVNFNYGSATTLDGRLTATGTLNNNGQTLVGAGSLNLDHGLLSGWGTVAVDTITSSGSIVARNGNLVLSAATLFTNTGLLQNNVGASLFVEAPVILNGGPMTVNAGGAVSFSQPVTNAAGKTISLLGGTLAAQALTNFSGGTVSGFGQITGDLFNNGTVDLYGPTQIVGNLANNDGASFTVSNVQTLVTGSTINFGVLHTVKGTIIFHGGFTNYGVYDSDPSTQYFQDLTVSPSGTVTGGAGDRFIVSGNFTNRSTRTDTWNTAAAELRFDGGGTHTLTLGSAAGAMAWGTVVVERGNTLQVAGETPWRVAGELALEQAVVSGSPIVAEGTLRASKGTSTVFAPVTFDGDAAVIVEALADLLVLRNNVGAAAGSVITKTGDGTLQIEGLQDYAAATRLDVLGGTVNLASDAGAGEALLSITVSDATVNFDANQHLDRLVIDAGGTVCLRHARLVVLNDLQMGGIDLGPTTLTPEPASLSLLALGGLWILSRRRSPRGR